MKITVLHFGLPNYDNGLDAALSVVVNTLNELGEMQIETVRAAFSNIPLYDGLSSKTVEGVVKTLQNSDGIIVAVPASLSSVNALCKTFFEHMQSDEYKNVFRMKNCLALVTSMSSGERGALDGLSYILSIFGAYDAVRIAIGGGHAANIENEPPLKELVERQTEDYYRIIRQNRKYPISTSTESLADVYVIDLPDLGKPQLAPKKLSDNEYERLFGRERTKQTAAELLEKRNAGRDSRREISGDREKNEEGDREIYIDRDDREREKDREKDREKERERVVEREKEAVIFEITQQFVDRLSKTETTDPALSFFQPPLQNKADTGGKPPVARVRNVKQMTFSLPHHFQPHLAAGLNAVMQMDVSGVETFSCYLTLSNTDCTVSEGISEQKDITIMVDSKVWSDILKGKYTAQKAFMIGQLKVRGNFMLLTRFDSLFTLNML